MKVSYVEGLANHNGPESCGAAREGGVEALAGPTRRAAHPKMAERRCVGGWETDTSGRRNAPGRKCIAAFGERLSSLRIRPVGPSVAPEASSRRCNSREVCR